MRLLQVTQRLRKSTSRREHARGERTGREANAGTEGQGTGGRVYRPRTPPVRLKPHQNKKPNTDGKLDLSGRRHPEPCEGGGGEGELEEEKGSSRCTLRAVKRSRVRPEKKRK